MSTTINAEFFAGHVAELSLSVDNLFVFSDILVSFAVNRHLQLPGAAVRDHRACCWCDPTAPTSRSSTTETAFAIASLAGTRTRWLIS